MIARLGVDAIDWDESQRAITDDGPFTGELVEHYADGTLAGLQTYRHGFQDGPERQYHPDGSLAYEGEWTWSRGVGTHRSWYPNGRLKAEYRYNDNGQLIEATYWNEDGTAAG
jgi:antitoxin component YwqK of YwqJK toxin-antitoxin module